MLSKTNTHIDFSACYITSTLFHLGGQAIMVTTVRFNIFRSSTLLTWDFQRRQTQARLLEEQKQRGFVFHYRQVPELGPALGDAARAIIAAEGDRFAVTPAHMAWEVRPRGADKASAVQTLMTTEPFEGRRPIFIGDDVIAGGASKIFTNVPAGRVILGSPAVKMETQVEINKAIRRLPRMAAQFAELQKTVTRLLQKD